VKISFADAGDMALVWELTRDGDKVRICRIHKDIALGRRTAMHHANKFNGMNVPLSLGQVIERGVGSLRCTSGLLSRTRCAIVRKTRLASKRFGNDADINPSIADNDKT
jgi:hypothetical protein